MARMERGGTGSERAEATEQSAAPAADVPSAEGAQHAEARFRAICECAPLGIFVTEFGRGTVYVNPAMERILGWPAEELFGGNWQRTVHPEDREHLLAAREQAFRVGAPFSAAVRYLRKDGKVVWTNVHAAPMRRGESVFGYVGTLEDITEHKKLQAELAVSERLASVGTLAAGVAHEVNTPLAAALGGLEWMASRLERLIERYNASAEQAEDSGATALGEHLRELQEPLRDAREAAERVRLITRDLKLFSGPEEERQGPVDLARVLDSATRLAWHELRHRARVVRDDPELPAVQGSEARLGQVFLNLLINAAQAIPEGSADQHTVRVSARKDEAGAVIVEVSDTGTGIAPDVIERIFDPFFTTKPHGIGTGLGLAICHRIVSGFGGQIEVESELGRGTTFRVVLRAAGARSSASGSPRAPLAPTRRARILVIDDDEPMTNVIDLILSEHHDVKKATSARAALGRLLSGEHYDLILCDLMMPDMGGMDFHAQLTATLPEIVGRVVFLTGGAFTPRARDFLDRVPNARIDKPFEAQELLALVNERTR